MSLKNRLIANIICSNGNNVVQSVNFKHTNVIGNAVTAVDFYNNWAIDEIILLDISRTNNYRKKFYKILDGVSKRCFVPLTAGGWVTNINEINELLKFGADKVSINTEAILNPTFISQASNTFGSQCIVVSIDVKKLENGKYKVFSDRGRKNTELDPIKWAKKVEELGAGEILLTSINQDGSKKGYDLELTKSISESVSIPVIVFGGVGDWQHFVDGITKGKADAVSAGNIFHYTEQSTYNAKMYMIEKGLNVRVPQFYKIPMPRKPKYLDIF